MTGPARAPTEYTRGPWRWELNNRSKAVSLSGTNPDPRWKTPFDWHLMTFDRYGMSGAAPAFVDADGVLRRADAFAVPAPGRLHHADWFRLIDHPDAHLIAAAPDLLEALKSALPLVERAATEETRANMAPTGVKRTTARDRLSFVLAAIAKAAGGKS